MQTLWTTQSLITNAGTHGHCTLMAALRGQFCGCQSSFTTVAVKSKTPFWPASAARALDAGPCHRIAVCLWLVEAIVSPTKWPNRTRFSLTGDIARIDPTWTTYWTGVHNGATWRIRLNLLCPATMRAVSNVTAAAWHSVFAALNFCHLNHW